MTTHEENRYIHDLLPRLARHAAYHLSELENASSDVRVLYAIAQRLQDEGLATNTDESSTLRVSITPKGRRIAQQPDGYLGYLTQQDKQQRTEIQRTLITFWSTVISAAAAVVTIGISLWLNNSLEQTNAQVEAQGKRIKALEVQLQHSEQNQRRDTQPKPH